MQFTISTIALVASLMASEAAGTPISAARGQMCGTAPTGSGTAQPLSNPQASTAEGCKAAGQALKSCQSFAFGLPAKAAAPVCKLFSVPAAQVPAQATNIVVFDLACSNVPTKAPTTSNPVGLLRRSQVCGAAPSYSGTATPLSTPSVSTAEECKEAAATVSGCKSFTFGLPTGASTPVCQLFSVAAAQVPAQATSIEVFDIGCSDIPNTKPTQEHPVGLVDETATTTASKSNTDSGKTSTSSNSNTDSSKTSTTSNTSAGNSKTSTTSNTIGADVKISTSSKSTTGSDKTSTTSNTSAGNGKTSTAGNTSNTSSNNGNSGATTTGSTSKNMCGSAPTGSTNAAPSPLKTDTAITSAEACLALGKATSGCKAVEFGKTSSNGASQCVLFTVAASNIPARTTGQSFVVYDIAC